ncbi:MAG: STAS domain-containing protein [Selenomonadaceae bacterium]|nr:STAS domain-containing protein [Selenomonadaceae bacterium]
MNVTVERDDNIKIVALDGQLDVASSDKARDEVAALIDSKPMIVNLEKCTYVSSSGLRALLMIAKTAKAKGTKVIYAAAIDEVIDVFEMTGFIKMLHCVKTIEDAEKELK